MAIAQTGDTVRINYSGRLIDGTPFDSSEGRAPLEIVLGAGQVITGLEQHLTGMEEGARSTVTIPAGEAYGERRQEAIQQFERTKLPSGVDVRVGTKLQARTSDGGMIPITVVDLNEASVTVDANHPLAGQDLVFDVELLDVVKAA